MHYDYNSHAILLLNIIKNNLHITIQLIKGEKNSGLESTLVTFEFERTKKKETLAIYFSTQRWPNLITDSF